MKKGTCLPYSNSHSSESGQESTNDANISTVSSLSWKRKKNQGQTGFSVAFGSTRYSGSADRRAPFVPLAQTLSARGMNSYGERGHAPLPPPLEICRIGLSKMQFPAFSGSELGDQNYDRNYVFFFFSRLYALHNKVSKIRVKSFFG